MIVRILASALELSDWILFVVQAPGSIDRFSIGVATSFYVSVNPRAISAGGLTLFACSRQVPSVASEDDCDTRARF